MAVSKVSGPTWVVKAQIHAGGRGKGGGVKVVSSSADAVVEAKKMFGMNLVTPQTGPEGKLVQRLYIENGSDIKTSAPGQDPGQERFDYQWQASAGDQ